MPDPIALAFFLVLSALLAGCLREHWRRNG
jgi:hypothetical protein